MIKDYKVYVKTGISVIKLVFILNENPTYR